MGITLQVRDPGVWDCKEAGLSKILISGAVQRIAEAHDSTPAAVSLAWLMERPAVSTLLVGATRLEQLAQNLAAADLELTAAETAELEQVSRLGPRYPQTVDAFTYQDKAYRVLGRLPEGHRR